MRASEVIRQYQNGQRNFQGQNLRGANFKGQDLRGAITWAIIKQCLKFNVVVGLMVCRIEWDIGLNRMSGKTQC